MTKAKRPQGRPKNADKPVQKTINFAASSVAVLAELSEKYRHDAPAYMRMSDRMILEALIHYADREDLGFEVLFGVTADASKA